MSKSHLLCCLAAMLLVACAAHKASRVPARVEEAKTAVAAHPSSKPHAGKKPSSAATEKNTALPAREVGYYLDVLQGRLQQQLDSGVIIGRQHDSIVLDFSRRLSFMPDSAQLDDVDRGLLQPLVKILEEYRAALVSVRVSADDDAPPARKLAQQRAAVIARALAEAGVAAARVVTVVPTAPARDEGTHVEVALSAEMRGD